MRHYYEMSPRRLRRLAVIGLVAIIVVAAAGCGGGGHRKSKGQSASLKFFNRANAICSSYRAKVTALRPPGPGVAGLPAYVTKSLPIIESTFAQLKLLHPPSFQRSLFRRWVATGDVLVADLKKLRTAALRGNRAEVQRLRRLILRNNSAGRVFAQSLGLNMCASS